MRDSLTPQPANSILLPISVRSILSTILLSVIPHLSHAAEPFTVTGSAFEAFVRAQDTSFQRQLEQILPDSLGYQVTGPIDPATPCAEEMRWVFRSVRVICPDLESVKPAIERLRESKLFRVRKTKEQINKAKGSSPSGFRGVIVSGLFNKLEKVVVLQTVQQTRWLVWARGALLKRTDSEQRPGLKQYSLALSNYFHHLDTRQNDFPAPRAVDFDVSDDSDPFSPAPLEIIDDPESFQALLDSNRVLKVDFARHMSGFVPTGPLLDKFIADAPRIAFTNKGGALFQRQIQAFCEKAEPWRSLQTLSRSTADSLELGEYFFAVGMSGKIRFGHVPQEGQPVANETFLFPGEPVLTAGRFSVCCRKPGRILKVSTLSPEYFYSNLAPTIRDDIAQRSDQYVSTLGHFLEAMQRLGLPTKEMVISKF